MKIKTTLTFTVLLGISFLFTSNVNAQSCSGTASCGNSYQEVCTDTTGADCIEGDLGCTCSNKCVGNSANVTCGDHYPALSCNASYMCETLYGAVCVINGSCSLSVTTSTCGNGIAETGETCGEPGLTCSAGYYCSSCRCYVSGTSGDPSDPTAPSGSCVSDFCAGTDQCTALGGTTGAIGPRPSGGDCSSGTLMCCVDGGSSGGTDPLACDLDWGGFDDPSPIFVGDNIVIPVRIQYTTVSTDGYVRLYGNCGGSPACDISSSPWYNWGIVRDTMNRRIPIVLSANEAAENIVYEVKGYVRNSFSEPMFPCASVFRQLDILAQYRWWQASGGSAVAMGGSITANLPSGLPLITTYPNQDPGAAAFAGNIDLGEGQVSANNFKIHDNLNYDFPSYSDFVSYIPSTANMTALTPVINSPDLQLLGSTDPKGYVWLRSNSSLTLNNAYSSLDRKVIIFVDGDVVINDNITLANNNSFLMIIAGGDITIGSGVTNGANPALEGIFYAQNQFRTLSSGIIDDQLVIRGSVAANNFSLNRSLDPSLVDTVPAETFEFGPEILLNYPRTLNKVTIKWREIAP